MVKRAKLFDRHYPLLKQNCIRLNLFLWTLKKIHFFTKMLTVSDTIVVVTWVVFSFIFRDWGKASSLTGQRCGGSLRSPRAPRDRGSSRQPGHSALFIPRAEGGFCQRGKICGDGTYKTELSKQRPRSILEEIIFVASQLAMH